MRDTPRKITLDIIVGNDTIQIPFTSFERVDSFTSLFDDAYDLCKFFFGETDVLLDDVRINYIYKRPGINDISQKFCSVKYNMDNFSEQNLKECLINYFRCNPDEIRREKWQLIYILKNMHITKCRNNIYSEYNVLTAIDKLFNKGYKTKRDLYFLLKTEGVFADIIPKSLYSIKKLEQPKNSYLEYLYNYSKVSENDDNFLLENVSLFDIEELNMNFDNPLLDGMDKNVSDIEKLLKMYTSLKKQEIICILNNIYEIKNKYRMECGKKRCLK